GSATLALFEAIMRAKPHPEQGFRSCLGILRLAKEYGVDRLEAACRRGNDIGARSYGSIASILQHGLDRAYAPEEGLRRRADKARQHPWPWLLPLTKGDTMLTHPSYERLIALGLTGMAKALEEQRRQSDLAVLDFEERLALIIDRETTKRENKRLATWLKFAP